MHQAVSLGTLQDLIGFLFGDQTVRPGLRIVDGIVVEVHAHVLFQMAAALAHEPPGAAAGTWPHRDRPGVFHQLCHLVVACLVGVVLNGALHRDHAHHVHAHVHKGRQHGHAAAGVFLKALTQHRVLIALFPVGEDPLHDTGYPDGIVPAVLAVHPADADDPCGAELIQLLTGKCHALFRALCDFFRGAVGLQTQVHHDLAHVVVHDRLENFILRVVVGDAGVGQALQADLGRQLQNIGSVCHSLSPLIVR